MGTAADAVFAERERHCEAAVRLEIHDRVLLETACGYDPATYSGVRHEAADHGYETLLAERKRTVCGHTSLVMTEGVCTPRPGHLWEPPRGRALVHYARPEDHEALIKSTVEHGAYV